ncbi:MAG: YicC family protein [Gammaproteobacteria bacterium]|nr:MAG: YicC family protein [Gammaproteobacteria bacterium]
MTSSMTGFALCRRNTSIGDISWEIRSVNQRFLDINLRLPDIFRGQEEAVRQRIKSRVARGKVECCLKFQPVFSTTLSINQSLLDALVNTCEDLRGQIRQAQPINLLEMLQWPGLLNQENDSSEQIIAQTMQVLDDTLQQFVESRKREGKALAETLQQRCETLRQQVDLARVAVPEAVEQLREKIRSRINEIEAEVDGSRLEQELVYWSQKMDVSEEIDRLGVHIDEVGNILKSEKPVGRRLDFIVQEMNREANTLGSKAVNSTITQIAVEMKVLIEQMREQVQNVE